MARIKWDQMAEKFFEGGCNHGVCFTGYDKTTEKYTVGMAWNGISGFTDNPSGADEQASYADNIKYISLRGAENYGGTIKCFWYPDNFRSCLGKKKVVDGVTVSQQGRETFGFAVSTLVGNDTKGTEAGETIHIVWNATTSPSSKDYSSLNESPSPSELSFEFTANPVDVGTNYKPTCNMEICNVGMEQGTAAYTAFETLKTILYGSDTPVSDSDYTLLTAAPADWSTNYTDYYTRSGAGTSESPYTYTNVTGDTAPTFAANTYYKGTGPNGYLPTPAAIIELFGGSVNGVG